MNRPRFDGIPIWPAFALAAVGTGLLIAAHALARVVDDAHTIEE